MSKASSMLKVPAYGLSNIVYPKRGIWLMVPGLLGFLLFYWIPFLSSLYFSVVRSNLDHAFVGLQNYAQVISNQYYQLALKNSIVFAVAFPLTCLLISILFALAIRARRQAQLIQLAILLPLFLPSASIALTWRLLFENQDTWLWQVVSTFHSKTLDMPWFALFSLCLWRQTGINAAMILAALHSMNHEIEEAAKLDGAYGWRLVWHILVPYLKPVFIFLLIYNEVSSLRVFREAYLLYGAYPSPSIYQVQHYMNNHFGKLNYPNMVAGAVIFAVVVGLILYPLIAGWMSYKREEA